MRANVARCVYAFSNAPIKASVSVISASGAPQVATTVVGERDGWLYMSARNFEFSAPTVRVKLEQEAPAPAQTPAPTQTQTPVPTPTAMKTTITCVKGKSVKKVIGTAPKCPSGYKLKK
jgi:hypothetical protein